MKKSVGLIAVLLCTSTLAPAQGGQKPTGQKPAPTTRKPATSNPAPIKPPPPVAPTPAAPPPSDVRFKSRYTSGTQGTESTTYLRGSRERYELGDMILLRQHDLKQSVQISSGARTYLMTPDTSGGAAAPAADKQLPAGVVNVETSVADVGERKTMFGQQARRVMTVIDRQPQPGACDQSKQRMETDGWHIDAPKALSAQPPSAPPASAAACRDDIKSTSWAKDSCWAFPLRIPQPSPVPTASPSCSCRWK